MKKTLLITNFFAPAIGGIENYYLNVCTRLEPSEIVVLTTPHPEAMEFDAQQKYKVIRTDFFSGMIPPRWRPLKKTIRQIIKDEGIEQIVFGHFHPYCTLGLKLKLPYFIFTHGTDITQIKNNWWQRRALRRSCKYFRLQKVIANSRFLYDELKRLLGDVSKVEIIYPGIDAAVLAAPIADLDSRRDLLGIAKDDIVMLSMGRVVVEKNFAAIIKMMPELLAKIPKLKYVVVGDGAELENLKNLAQSYGLKYSVIFTGAIKNDAAAKAFYYQLSHIFITASLKPEGFGISYLEAAAAKTAVIASKLGGSAEAVQDGVTGILVDPTKPDEIQTAIIKLISDRELWEKMSSAGLAWAQNFDWSKQMEKIKKLL